jgi:alpha-methylacyl-CoA racemase
MMLADMGAEVIRVDRSGMTPRHAPEYEICLRGCKRIAMDLKSSDGIDVLLQMVEGADALLEGFRPGVMERLGVGPDECLARNPKLVYGRMTGWGQKGPRSASAGHDINYISLAGALAHFARPGVPPVAPLGLVGDLAGGGMLLAYGVVCALLEAQKSLHGQVIDSAIVDGVALLMSTMWGHLQEGDFDEQRPGTSLYDMGSHFYNVYRCADGEFMSVACLEGKFYEELLRRIGLEDDPEFAHQMDAERWPQLRTRMEHVFVSRTRAEWCEILDTPDICVAPVLRMSEAASDPHLAARGTFVQVDGVTQPAPAPRFSRTDAELRSAPVAPGHDTRAVLQESGFRSEQIEKLLQSGVVAEPW